MLAAYPLSCTLTIAEYDEQDKGHRFDYTRDGLQISKRLEMSAAADSATRHVAVSALWCCVDGSGASKTSATLFYVL